MNVKFKESFLKDLRAVKVQGLFARVKSVIESVEQAQKLEDVASLKKLKGSEGTSASEVANTWLV